MNTLEHIELLGLTSNQEYLVNGLVSGLLSPRGFYSVEKWIAQCYHIPSTGELVIQALADVLQGYGVEPIRADRNDDSIAEYINMGETYTPTIVLCDGKFEVCSWGDWYKGWLQDQAEWGMMQCPNCSQLSSEFIQTGFSDNCPLCNYPVIEHETFTLRYETGEQVYTLTLEVAGYSQGCNHVKYSLSGNSGVIFEGSDLGVPSCQIAESKETAGSLLDFLTLQEGDTDDEYFENYTHRQLEFRDGPAEEVKFWGYELEEELEDQG